MPLVTVKQPDGTYAKITLEEFMQRQKKTHSPQTPPTTVVEPTLTAPPVAPQPSIATPPRLVVREQGAAAAPQSVTEEPVSTASAVMSLPTSKTALEDVKPASPKLPPAVSSAHTIGFLNDLSKKTASVSASLVVDIEPVLKKISFTVPTEYEARLRNIIELRLREVRNDDQTKDVLKRPFTEGGLQLDPVRVEEVLSACAYREQLSLVGDQRVIKSAQNSRSPAYEPGFSGGKHSESSPRTVDEVIPKRTVETIFSERPKARPIMNDVVYKPLAIGPIEEIGSLTLTDFRRLSPVAQDAAMRLEQKFVNLKGESIVLFLEALTAWRKSSLYQEYTDRVLYALLHRESLDAILRKTKSISYEEFLSLVAMEKRLTI